MAKPIVCGANCRIRHPFNKKNREECERSRACACNMSELSALNPNLYDAAIAECNSGNMPKDADDYLCNNIGGETLFDTYGILQCGYDPTTSTLGKIEQEREAKVAESDAQRMKLLYILLAVVAVVLVIWLLTKK